MEKSKPPIAPKPAIKKPPPIEESPVITVDECSNNYERSSDSSTDSLLHSDNSSAVADMNAPKVIEHPCVATISNDNHKQLKSSVTVQSSSDTTSSTSPDVIVSVTAAHKDLSLTPPPRSKRGKKLKNMENSDVKLREKADRGPVERDSKPIRGTVLLKVNDLQAKVGDRGTILKLVRSPLPKPRQKSSLNGPVSDTCKNSSTDNLLKELPQPVPVPKPRNSLILIKNSDIEDPTNELCDSKSSQNSDCSSSVEEQSSQNEDIEVINDHDLTHYGEIWVHKSTPVKKDAVDEECKNALSRVSGLERTASAPVSSSSSPKILPRKPSAPPPPPPKKPLPLLSAQPTANKKSTKKLGPTRPPPPVPKGKLAGSQSPEGCKKNSSSTQDGSVRDSDANVYSDVDENVYHEPDIDEVDQELSQKAPAALDQVIVDENSNMADDVDDSEYMVPVDTLQDWPEQSAPLSPFLKAKTATLESAISNIYEDLVSSSDDDDDRSSGTTAEQADDVYSDHLDETFARSSSESEGELEEDEEARTEKLKKKGYKVAHEILTSEEEFYDKLVLLNIDFRQHISNTVAEHGQPVLPADRTNKILNQLPQLANINEDLLKDIRERLDNWEENPRLADVFVRKGPFLQMYTSYIRDFQNMTTELDNAIRDIPEFAESLKVFERSERCRNLQIRHYMLKPIQRIPQYRLLLTEYQKCLTNDSPDRDDTRVALEIVSKVADHANEAMKENDSLQSLLELQSLLVGDFRVIEPSRVLVRKGDVYKQSRKELQPRTLLLFNDYLVITTPLPGGHYKIKHVLPVLNMQVNKRIREEFQKEFIIITKKRSFTSVAYTPKERDEWMDILESTIAERERKIGTYNRGLMDNIGSKASVLGDRAPVWIPDDRVTMCMICSVSFGLINRRHHCRACGKVVCGTCSVFRAPLKYTEYKAKRSCGGCYAKLLEEAKSAPLPPSVVNHFAVKGGKGAPSSPKVRTVLKEVHASDVGEHSGYLGVLSKKKWEKYWFVLKEKVLYKYNACEDTAAIESKPLLGYTVSQVDTWYEGFDQAVMFSLQHPAKDIIEPVVFKSDTADSAEKWIQKMSESTTA